MQKPVLTPQDIKIIEKIVDERIDKRFDQLEKRLDVKIEKFYSQMVAIVNSIVDPLVIEMKEMKEAMQDMNQRIEWLAEEFELMRIRMHRCETRITKLDKRMKLNNI